MKVIYDSWCAVYVAHDSKVTHPDNNPFPISQETNTRE